jgi:hypothetical protein
MKTKKTRMRDTFTAIGVRLTVAVTKPGTGGQKNMRFTILMTAAANLSHSLKAAKRGRKIIRDVKIL